MEKKVSLFNKFFWSRAERVSGNVSMWVWDEEKNDNGKTLKHFQSQTEQQQHQKKNLIISLARRAQNGKRCATVSWKILLIFFEYNQDKVLIVDGEGEFWFERLRGEKYGGKYASSIKQLSGVVPRLLLFLVFSRSRVKNMLWVVVVVYEDENCEYFLVSSFAAPPS